MPTWPFILAALAASSLTASDAYATIAYAVRTGDVVRFDTANPGATLVVIAANAAWSPFPQGLDFGSDGNLYMLRTDGALWRINPTSGQVTSLPAVPRPRNAGFYQDLAFDPSTGDLLAVHSTTFNLIDEHRLMRISTSGSSATEIGRVTGLAPIAVNSILHGLAIDSSGQRFLASALQVFRLGGATGLDAAPLGAGMFTGQGVSGMGIDRSAGDALFATGNSTGFAAVGPTGAPGTFQATFTRMWDITFIPAPAAAGLLAASGLLSASRRRRVW